MIEVYAGSDLIVARALAAFLGECSPGHEEHLIEDADRIEDHFESWRRPADSTAARMHKLARAKRDSAGHIEIRTGTDPARYLTWFDVSGDGRYLTYRNYRDLHIEPVGKNELISAIRRRACFEL
ncbi:ESX secretion-associated protein EspG [Nocardia sp. NPDC059177]|uniref:ESX secretion-associated protein EspG n=1 Tax=Nocardia sp. NPDC059177 TaxID=3346759 RepID=UPI00368812B6